MTRRIGKLSLATLFMLGLFSCGGGGGGGGGSETSSTSQIPPYPFVENEPSVEDTVPQQVDVAYFDATRGNQKLEVYFPKGVTLLNPEEEEETTRALEDVTPDSGPDEVKIAWNGQEVWITMKDPDTYDTNLFIAMELVNGEIDFDNQLVSAKYETSDGEGDITETWEYDFDVFHWFAVVPKDNSSDENWKNKARLKLNFGTKLLAEGDSDTYWFGGWDLFGEGIKYKIKVRANDLPDVSISANYDTDDDSSNDPECPIYVYTNSSGQKVIEFPTKDINGDSYDGTHCVAYSVTPGEDDKDDGEKVTFAVSKDGGSNYSTVLDHVDPDDTTYFDPDYKNKVNLNSNLNAGKWGDDIVFKVSQDVAINGTSSTVNDHKEYRFKTYGANDAVTVTVCITADSSADSCTPHDSAPKDNVKCYDIIDSNYKYKDKHGDYERYWHDLDDDDHVDEDEPVILVREDDKGIRHVVLPSGGGKVFYALDHNASDASDIHGVFRVELEYSDDGGSKVNPHGEVVKNDGEIEGYTHIVTLDSKDDDTSDPKHFKVPANSSGNERGIYFLIYKDFSWPDNNGAFKSRVGATQVIYFSLNTPTSSG